MRFMAKIILAVMACAAITFADAVDSTKQVASPTPVVTNQQKMILPAGIKDKAPTSWTKIKDLFL